MILSKVNKKYAYSDKKYAYVTTPFMTSSAGWFMLEHQNFFVNSS